MPAVSERRMLSLPCPSEVFRATAYCLGNVPGEGSEEEGLGRQPEGERLPRPRSKRDAALIFK